MSCDANVNAAVADDTTAGEPEEKLDKSTELRLGDHHGGGLEEEEKRSKDPTEPLPASGQTIHN